MIKNPNIRKGVATSLVSAGLLGGLAACGSIDLSTAKASADSQHQEVKEVKSFVTKASDILARKTGTTEEGATWVAKVLKDGTANFSVYESSVSGKVLTADVSCDDNHLAMEHLAFVDKVDGKLRTYDKTLTAKGSSPLCETGAIAADDVDSLYPAVIEFVINGAMDGDLSIK